MQRSSIRIAIGGLVMLLAGGCASPAARKPVGRPDQSAPPPIPGVASATDAEGRRVAPSQSKLDPADAEAIASLAGAFDVSFTFTENEALRPGYELRAPSHTAAREVVLLLERSADFVSLQHLLLVADGSVIVKHWREDWRHAPATALAYIDAQTWEAGPFESAGRPGTWVRSVYEADAAPAYSAWGRWTHKPEGSFWSSQSPVLAPLPRREAARIGEYEVLWVQDDVTLRSQGGWEQLQQITKAPFVPSQTPLAREQGRIEYRPLPSQAAAEAQTAAEAYWQRVGPYWAQARRAWAQQFSPAREVTLSSVIDGQPRWRKLFDLIQAAADDQADPDSIYPALEAAIEQSVVSRP